MTVSTFIFECSSSTYLDCVEKNLFGSNKPWPLEIKAGDYCLLHHYEIGWLLGLWQATSNGEKNLVPKIRGGKFPYHVKVKLVMPKVTDVSKSVLQKQGVDAAVGRFSNCHTLSQVVSVVAAFRLNICLHTVARQTVVHL